MFRTHSIKTSALAAIMWGMAASTAGAADIVIAQSTDATTLDPAFRADTVTGSIQRHIYDSLLFRNADMEIEPRLAESWEQVGPTEWIVKLRPNLKFSNGEPLDAEAVKFSFERVQNPELKSPIRGWWAGFTGLDVLDERTLKITTSKVDPLFEARLSLFAPVPPKYVTEKGDTAFAQEPISSGPYKMVEWRRDEAIVLEPNPDYWGPAPDIDNVTFRVLPEELARIAANRTGEADVIGSISPTQALSLEGGEDVRVERASSTRVMTVNFDIKQTPGEKQAFRDAVAHAINQDEIINGLFRGYATKVNSMLSPGTPGWPRDINFTREHDLEKAKQLVAELGIGDQEIVMRTPSNAFALDRETALAVAGQLKAAGLNIKVQTDEWGVFFGDLKNAAMSPLYLNSHGNVWADPYPQIDAFQRTGGFISTWSDPELDVLLDKSLAVKGQERLDVFKAILERLNETSAVVPLFAQQDLYGVRDRVTWTPRPDGHVFAFEMAIKE